MAFANGNEILFSAIVNVTRSGGETEGGGSGTSIFTTEFTIDKGTGDTAVLEKQLISIVTYPIEFNIGDLVIDTTNGNLWQVTDQTDAILELLFLICLKGDKGDKGDKGATGSQGVQGEKGDTGATGATGATGEKGADGANGAEGLSMYVIPTWYRAGSYYKVFNGNKANVPSGHSLKVGDLLLCTDGDAKGQIYRIENLNNPSNGFHEALLIADINGARGATGEKGADGKDGTSVTVKSVSESTADGGSNTVTFSDGKTLTVKNGSKGSKGDKGDQGIQGIQGVQGEKGDTGARGEDGEDGYTPVKGVDYYTDADKAEFSEYIASELAKRGQLKPEFANSIEECIDTTKMYVLPDGFIYAYMYSEATGPSYTNLAGNVQYDKRLSSSGKISSTALTGAAVTGFIPVTQGDVVRVKGLNIKDDLTSGSAYPYFCFYTGASEDNVTASGEKYLVPSQNGGSFPNYTDTPNGGVAQWTAFTKGNSTLSQHTNASALTHIRISGKYFSDKEIIVTVNEEISEGTSGGYSWRSTGHAFVPADYEAEINKKANKTDIPTALKNPHALTINGTEYDGSKAVEVNIEASGNILYGKKWVACGDSFTANGYNASDGFDESVYIYQDGRFAGKRIVYPYIIGLRNNMNIVNKAVGGQTMAASSNSFMSVYQNIDADADYITIMLGINDKVQGLAVGTLEDSTSSTFCGAFNIAMEHILENHPFAHIGIMVSNGTNDEIMEATRGIAERWGVPYLDFGSPQVPLMNRWTGRNVCAKAQQIREKNFCVISDGTTPTNGHPNTAAHEYESTFIEAWLRTL